MACFAATALTGCAEIEKAYNDTFNGRDPQNEKPGGRADSTSAGPPVVLHPESKCDMNASDWSECHKAYSEKQKKINEQKQEENAIFKHPEQLKEAQDKLRTTFQGKPIRFHSGIHFYHNRIAAELYNPDKPDEVDKYTYEVKTKAWQKGEPVKSPNVGPSNGPWDANRIDFSKAHDFYKMLAEKAKEIEGAEPITSLNISKWDDALTWRGYIRATRANYYLYVSIDFTKVEFKKS